VSTAGKFSLSLIVLLFLGLCAVAVQAQANQNETHSVTGCLQKGVEPGGFFIPGEDGTMWELSGKINAPDVGYKVTVNGHVLHRSAAEEAKFADYEKQEAKGKPYADFQVTKSKRVGDSCQ
jgi:hypothetical protein